MHRFSAFIDTIRRHPLTSAFDVSLATLAMTFGVVFALAYDLEAWWGDITPRERTICIEELLALALLFALCATIFVWRRVLEERQDRTRQGLADSEIEKQKRLAMADPLTGLPNRREFLHALALAKEPTVFLLDLNGFKGINDKFGHATGDDVLNVVAARFRTAARSLDLVARLGGDEFAVIAQSLSSRAEARQIALRFIQALDDAIEINARSHFVGVAIGIASAPFDGSSAAELLQSADVAMYEAKRTGRPYVSFSGDLHAQNQGSHPREPDGGIADPTGNCRPNEIAYRS